jgi:hypothetical protein
VTFEGRFVQADEFLNHVDGLMAGLADDLVRTRYLGFIAVAAVTSYELAIKDILYLFSDKKHRALGELARSKFNRLNGQIKLVDLKERHVSCFGRKYFDRFEKKLCHREEVAQQARLGDIRTSYGNMITWRHSFVHRGEWPATATYDDVKRSYELGKEVVRALDDAMVR